jgi:HK97 gp10 family phage protein
MARRDRNNLDRIARQVKPAVEEAIRDGAELVVARAKARAPVRTGALKAAIHSELVHNGYEVVAGDGDVFYGHLVEHGTHHSAAQPFLVPALEESRSDVIKIAEAKLRFIEDG